MGLEQQIPEDLKAAMKAKDKVRMTVLRSVLSGIKYLKAEGGHEEVSDEEVLTIVSREVKKRRDAIDTYTQHDRQELAAQEQAELDILLTYLPAQLSEAEVRELIQATIAELGVSGPGDKGRLMGALMPKVKGKADGKMVNMLVSECLA